jgi:adenylate cyclase
VNFKKFQSRILFYFLLLMSVVQIAGFVTFNATLNRNTRARIAGELETGALIFTKLVSDRTGQIALTARTLSDDYAFKRAYAFGDHGTTISALQNYRLRIGAAVMMIVSLDNTVVADTIHPARSGVPFEYPGLIQFATENQGAASIVFIDNKAYQMVVVPLMAPEPIAMICAGFPVNDTLAGELQKITRSHVSFLRTTSDKNWRMLASTLPEGMQKPLMPALAGAKWKQGKVISIVLNGDEYESLILRMGKKEDLGIKVVLQRSLREALAPYRRLRLTLFGLLIGGLAGAFAGAVWIARTVTKPVSELVVGVRRITAGDYGHSVAIRQTDEIGELATAFNDMTEGLAERDRVSDLLGKVVSPEIAQELLRKDIELGGEEREVTILFSDIRDFTTLSESRSPKDVLDILNTYLTRMSAIVEQNGGVVDKYIGDAVMALFGAPLTHEFDTDHALRAAVEMIRALKELNTEFKKRGLPELEIGVGVNTALVVAGNMGSSSRLNYTVIGDGVNLASRLEGLTKEKKYGAQIIISDETLKKAKGSYITRYLGEAAVKGKSEIVPIHALLDIISVKNK